MGFTVLLRCGARDLFESAIKKRKISIAAEFSNLRDGAVGVPQLTGGVFHAVFLTQLGEVHAGQSLDQQADVRLRIAKLF